MKKKTSNTPRRKRLKKYARLSQAKEWIKSHNGKNVVKRYSKWFGVDTLCALNELKLSGVLFTPESEQKIIRSYHQRIEQKRKQKQLRESKRNEYGLAGLVESDENFAFIAGYTSNGVPFGVTYEELEDEKYLTGELEDEKNLDDDCYERF